MTKMQICNVILALLASTITASPFFAFRTTDTDGTTSLRDYHTAKSGIKMSVKSGTCVVGEVHENGWAKVGVIDRGTFNSGFIHKSRLVPDSTCNSKSIELVKCELIHNELLQTQDFYDLEIWRSKYFEPTCNDGYFAESLSEIVTARLANNWEFELRSMQSEYLTDETRDLILKHIDQSAVSIDLDAIRKFSAQCKDDPKHICVKISKKLKQLPVKE